MLCLGQPWGELERKVCVGEKGQPGVLGASGHQSCCPLQLLWSWAVGQGPSPFSQAHPTHRGVLVPQPLAEEPCPVQELWVLCDSAGQQAQLGPLELVFFPLLTLKILTNSRLRSSPCIWNISDSLIALVSRHQPKITLCCGSALLWMEQNCTKPLPGCRDAPAATSGGNSPVCCQPWPGQEDTGARGSWSDPLITATARGASSLLLTPRPVLPRGAEREAGGDRFNEVGWGQREAPAGAGCPPGGAAPRGAQGPPAARLELRAGSWN